MEHPDPEAFGAYQRQCEQKTSTFFDGRVVWPRATDMTVDQDSTVSVLITLDPTADASKLLPGATAGSQAVKVTCGVKASVVFDALQFNISHSEPQYESLWPQGDAQWKWVVTPKTPGNHQLVFQLQPIVLVGPTGIPEDSNTAGARPFACQVTVAQDHSVMATIGRWTSNLTTFSGLVKALGALIVAVGGVWAVVRKWGQKRRDPRNTKDPKVVSKDAKLQAPATMTGRIGSLEKSELAGDED